METMQEEGSGSREECREGRAEKKIESRDGGEVREGLERIKQKGDRRVK